MASRKKKKKDTIDITNTIYYNYAREIVDGKVLVGTLERLACSRFLSDLERDDLEFRPEIVEKFIKFSSLIKHFKGKSSGQPFILEPWQVFIAANILGFYWRKSGLRRYTNSLICVSRKAGKTALAALFCLWYLIADGEDGAEVDLGANSREQAKIAFEFCEQYARQLDPTGKDLKITRNKIDMPLNASKINVFASDSTKLDGFNAHFALLDEYHAAKDNKLYSVLKSSQGQRENPMMMVISTCGFNMESPFYQMYQTYSEILHGLKQDDSSFAMIFALDDGWDYKDPKYWRAIAPNLGITVSEKYLQEQVTAAQNNPSEEVGILIKNFNKWSSTAETWILDKYIFEASKKFDFDEFKGDIAMVGIDLAAVSDFSAVAFTFKRDNKYWIKIKYYLPEECLKTSPNRDKYIAWKRQGLLQTTPGNVQDYDYILNDLLKVREQYRIRLNKIYYDRYNATAFVLSCLEHKLNMIEFSQSIGNFSRPTKEFERLMLSGSIVLDDNEITRFCLRNCIIKSDWNGNIKPMRSGNDNKIDGVIAAIQSLSPWIETMNYSNKIFFFK